MRASLGGFCQQPSRTIPLNGRFRSNWCLLSTATEILQYFCFPGINSAVALRNGDLLLFNPTIPHCVSSRCTMEEDVICTSLSSAKRIVTGAVSRYSIKYAVLARFAPRRNSWGVYSRVRHLLTIDSNVHFLHSNPMVRHYFQTSREASHGAEYVGYVGRS